METHIVVLFDARQKGTPQFMFYETTQAGGVWWAFKPATVALFYQQGPEK